MALVAGSPVLVALVAGLVGTGPAAALPAFALVGLRCGLSLPSRDRLVSATTDSADVGTSFGVVFTAAAVGSFVGPAVLGAVVERAGPAVAFLAVAGCCCLAAAVVVRLRAGLVGDRSARATTVEEGK